MIKKLLVLIIAFFPLLINAQSAFTIEGYGKSFKDGDSIFLSYTQGDDFIWDATVVKNNLFRFKGELATIAKGYVCRNSNPRIAELLPDFFSIYIEPGNIVLRSADSLNNSLVSGTPLNNDLATLTAAIKPIEDQRKELDTDFFTPEQLKDTALVNSTKKRSAELYFETFPLQLDFINKHRDSYVSLVSLARIARTSKFLPDVEKSFVQLAPALQLLPEGKDIARRIEAGRKIAVGMISPDFTQPDVHNKPVRLTQFRGKYVLVDFWASWCLPCRAENPNLVAAYEKYKNKKFTIVSISIDSKKDKEKWLTAIRKDKLPWLQASDLKQPNEAATLYGITTIPANILIDPHGKVIAKDLKGKELHEKLAVLLPD